MQYRPLGSTGIKISELSFGGGPVSGLMTAADIDRQLTVVNRAVECGLNWFDTAATYGGGQSERSLGSVFKQLGDTTNVHVATKVRIMPDDLADIAGHIGKSVDESLARLGLERVTLLQLHNSITARRGDEPTSLSTRDVLGPGGVLEMFEKLKSAGVCAHIGLTGIGQPAALREVIRSGSFETIQIPYHVLNPSAGRPMPAGFDETDYGNVIADCAERQMGVLAIRVFAAGALLSNPASPHTQKTPFFPLELYRRDLSRAARIGQRLGERLTMNELAVRFALSHPHISSALIGFGDPSHIDAAVTAMQSGPLPQDVLDMLEECRNDERYHQ